MKAMNDIVHIPLTHGRAELDTAAAVLRLFTDSDKPCLAFKLAGTLDYHDRPTEQRPVRLAEATDGRHFVFHGGDNACQKEIHLEISDGWIDYWLVATPTAAQVPVKCIHYGQDGAGPAAGSDCALEELFVLCPDRYGTAVPPASKVNVKLGVHSYRYDKDSEFCHDAGRAIIAPYVTAWAAGGKWLGVGTLEIPNSDWGLNMTVQAGKAWLDFDYGINLNLEGPHAFPRITFFTGPEKLATVRAYIDRLYADGLAPRPVQWEPFWSGPIYCFFADQMYEYQVARPTDAMLGEMEMKNRYCTDEFMDECVGFLKRHNIDYRVLIYDAGWFVMNGTWRPDTTRVKDLKATIRRLQGQGHKVLLWYAPFFACADSANYKAHPEIAAKKADGTPSFVTRLEGEVNYLLDYTHPATRELCRQDLAFMLSAEGMNADGLKLDCVHVCPDVQHRFHDNAWGTGERMVHRVMKFIYDEAKRLKPACLLNATAGNPFFNRTLDMHRLHDGLEYNLDMYEQRAWAAWVCGAGLSDLDDWSSYDMLTVRANVRKVVYGVPSLYAVRRRGCGRRLGCGFGHSYTVAQDELDLIGSCFDLAMKAPIDLSQEVFIDPDDKVFWRKHTRGPLAGFYAARTVSGNQAVAAYDEQAAYVVSIADAPLAVELPPGASAVRVMMVQRDGGSAPVERFELVDGKAVFEARRCCGTLRRYEIRYTL